MLKGEDKLSDMYEKMSRNNAVYKDNGIEKHNLYGNRIALSHEQQRIIFLEKLSQGKNSSYHIPIALKVKGILKKAALEKALKAIVQKHDILKTTFFDENGKTYQEIHGESIINLECIDLEGMDIQRESYIQNLCTEIFHQYFDLKKLPLFTMKVIFISQEESIMLLDIHHIIADEWTLNLLMKEFLECYSDIILGTHSFDDSVPKLQYVDYVEWQMKNTSQYATHLDYWRKKLKDVPYITRLPWRQNELLEGEGKGAYIKFILSNEITEKIRQIGRNRGVTLFVMLISIFSIQLFRLGAQKDIVIGTPVAGRNNYQLQDMFGLFVNTIPLRFDQFEDISFIDYLSNQKAAIYEAFAHQDVPFNLIVDALKIKRDLKNNPLVQVLFTLQNMSSIKPGNDLISVEKIDIDTGMAQFDLSLTFREERDEIIGFYEYNIEMFCKEDIQRYVNSFIHIAKKVTSIPNIGIFSMSILDDNEVLKLQKWQHGRDIELSERTLIEMFQRQVRKNPNHIAVTFENDKITYRELSKKAKRVACHLKKVLNTSESYIGVVIDYSVELVLAILAVLMLQKTYVPFDTVIPKSRIQFVVKDCGIRTILTTKKYKLLYEATEKQVQYIDINKMDCTNDIISPENGEINENDVACLIYTSGSTGNPKGVMISNNSLVNLMYSFAASYDVTIDDVMIPLTSIASSSFLGELFPMLCLGGSLVLPSREIMLDVDKLISVMKKNKVTILSSVPSLLSNLCIKKNNVDSLRLILSGGERFIKENYSNLSESIEIVNGYGVTEATVCSTYHKIKVQDLDDYDVESVGKPIINTEIYILDHNLNQVPEKCIGYIYIAGKGVSKGYVNNEILTEERFIQNPFMPNTILYDTGDLGYWKNGNVVYKGRRDNQIKMRGYRVELGEIENNIVQFEGVKDCVCIKKSINAVESHIVCFIVLEKSGTVEEVQDRVKLYLPFYMQPSEYISMEEIPLNSNGKKDLEYLASMEPPTEVGNIQKLTNCQEIIYDIWRELTGNNVIDIDDNFFDIGGHSILMMQVQAKIFERCHKSVDIVDLYKYTSIRLLSKFLDNGNKKGDDIKELRSSIHDRAGKARAVMMERRDKSL